MRKQLLVGATLVFILAIGSTFAADEPAKPAVVDAKTKQYKVQGKFIEMVNPDEKTETLTRIPAFVTLPGRKAEFHSGGSAALAGNILVGQAPSEPYGLSLKVTVTPLGEEDLVLDVDVKNIQVTLDQKVSMAKSASLASSRKANLGKSLKIILEEDAKGAPRQWLDLTVTEMDE